MSSDLAPYERLAAIAECELELVGEGRIDELEQLHSERAQLLAILPPRAPAGARPALERCSLLQRRVGLEIMRVREAVLLALADVERGRRAARGYAPRGRRTPRVEASA